ncbi:MAG TPA: class I SAM-dependent methyltransferase [Planctomycetota bacterium]|nr:class I SAM-dependent methyltransferase [Planctomycetota bacterium]
MNASDPLTPLRQLAAGAELHARETHRLNLGVDDVHQVDRILQAEAANLTPERREPLAACYGAWLGWLALQRWNARWIGLSEAAPPRVQVAGLVFSPMDAVRRRLQDPQSPSLPELLQKIDSWSREQAGARDRAPGRNKAAWDALAADPRFAGPVELPPDRDAACAALDEWLREVDLVGRKLLCLGAGGGRQGPLHALAGADVTVVDVSERQLDHDRKAGLKTRCASMDRLDGLGDASFDIVVQPVSACYVADLDRVHAEVARVLRPGGLYIVQHKQPGSLQSSPDDAGGAFRILQPYAEGGALPEPGPGVPHRESGTVEFIHTLDALLGGLCRAGFVIEDVAEPPRGDVAAAPGDPAHRALYLPPYLKVKARRRQ